MSTATCSKCQAKCFTRSFYFKSTVWLRPHISKKQRLFFHLWSSNDSLKQKYFFRKTRWLSQLSIGSWSQGGVFPPWEEGNPAICKTRIDPEGMMCMMLSERSQTKKKTNTVWSNFYVECKKAQVRVRE